MHQMHLSDKKWSAATRHAVLNCEGPQDDLSLPSDEFWYCGKIYNLGGGFQFQTNFSTRHYMTIWFKNTERETKKFMVTRDFRNKLLKIGESHRDGRLDGCLCKFVAYELEKGEGPEVLPGKRTRKESI
jgi:hypothetical protein